MEVGERPKGHAAGQEGEERVGSPNTAVCASSQVCTRVVPASGTKHAPEGFVLY